MAIGADGRFLPRPLVDRLADGFDIIGDCWIWQSNPEHNRGYGKISVGQVDGRPKFRMVHVAIYELLIGPIPDGLELDHLCRNRMCVNPDHLEPVTHRENMLRGDTIAATNAVKTLCVNGHELTGDNIYVPPKRPGRRYCRTCQTERRRKASRT